MVDDCTWQFSPGSLELSFLQKASFVFLASASIRIYFSHLAKRASISLGFAPLFGISSGAFKD